MGALTVGGIEGCRSIASLLTRRENDGLYSGAILHSEPFALPFRTTQAGRVALSFFFLLPCCSPAMQAAQQIASVWVDAAGETYSWVKCLEYTYHVQVVAMLVTYMLRRRVCALKTPLSSWMHRQG
jgi:hypothetical protein